MMVELVKFTPNPIDAIEKAASVCYDSKNARLGTLLKHCYESGHHSVLEFAEFTFHISGISRALSHQLVRHRMASYAQRSQRYVSENEFPYVLPDTIRRHELARKVFDDFIKLCQSSYIALQEFGIPNEDARFVLPNACCTEIYVKMNLRELIHFCNERLCKCAQQEIRKMAELMKAEMLKIDHLFGELLVPKCEAHKLHYCSESKKRSCGKWPTETELMEKLGLLEKKEEKKTYFTRQEVAEMSPADIRKNYQHIMQSVEHWSEE